MLQHHSKQVIFCAEAVHTSLLPLAKLGYVHIAVIRLQLLPSPLPINLWQTHCILCRKLCSLVIPIMKQKVRTKIENAVDSSCINC